MDESAEAITSLDVIRWVRADRAQLPLWCRWGQAKRSMRPVAVVMVDVDAEHLLEVSPAGDQDPVEDLARLLAELDDEWRLFFDSSSSTARPARHAQP